MSAQISMHSLARQLGVSVSTISRTFSRPDLVNDQTARRIREQAEQLGFRPGALLRGTSPGKTQLVALFAARTACLMGEYYTQLRSGMERELADRGHSLLLSTYDERTGGLGIQGLRDPVQVDGIIIIPHALGADDIARIRAIHVSLVIANHPGGGLPSVYVDDFMVGYTMARHLVALGHRRIACLAGFPQTTATEQRLEGVRACLREFGLAFPEHYLQRCAEHGCEDAIVKTAQLFSVSGIPEPTAVVTHSDAVAAGVYAYAAQAGRSIPHDLSVIGCGNTLASRFMAPALTSVELNAMTLGERSVQLLLDGNDGAAGALPFQLVARNSTRALHAQQAN